jgi:hypothetical protein
MQMGVKMTVTSTLILILIVSSIILGLQFFLSTRKTKWLGLILPVICFVIATVITIGIVFADSIFPSSGSGSSNPSTTDSVISENDDSQATDETNVTADVVTDDLEDIQTDTGSDFIYALLIFCLLNIPTMVLTAIYFSSRQNKRIGTTMKGK